MIKRILTKTLIIVAIIPFVAVSLYFMVITAGCVYGIYNDVINYEETEYFGFKESDFKLLDKYNDQIFFNGDGTNYKAFDCSNNTEKSLKIIKDWKPLPLSSNLDVWLNGGKVNKKNEIYYCEPALPSEVKLPNIKNGVYKFYDLHDESTNPSDDSEIFKRFSFDFCFAIYDLDTNRFYYFEHHT